MSRHRMIKRALLGAAALAGAAVLSGCVAATVGAGALATTGVAVAQERSTRQALTDTEIRVSLNNNLLNDSYGLFGDISTEVHEGRVLLTGSVPRQEDRLRAVQIVWATPHVAELINEITVEEDAGAGSYAEDVWISTQLRARLLGDAKVKSINYTVETVDQTVHLLGVARSEAELERVVGHASNVKGVRRVVSHVLAKHDDRRIVGTPPPADATSG
ncbi:MAG: BON domain-containing protein [Pseudomonadota bacterium]